MTSVNPVDITSELAVILHESKPDITAWRDNGSTEGISPQVAVADCQWSGDQLHLTMANGERFEATFAKVEKFSFES